MKRRWGYVILALIALETISIALYLGKAGQFGFPLDDAWTHQVYARNLALHGRIEFTPGIPSTGGTSFLWALLLALGYFLKIPFFWWTYILGGLFAIATAFLAAVLAQTYYGNYRNSVVVALICILEWHLAWAAVSGMEIGLFTCLMLLFFLLLARKISPFLLGSLAGIIALARPEGILLAMVYGLHLLFTHRREIKHLFSHGTAFACAFLIIISPWMAFNLSISNSPFPNTVSAKFMQYGYPLSVWKSLRYLWDVFIYFLNGPLLLLLPSAVFTTLHAIRTKRPLPLQPLFWSISLLGLYAVALPVIYDHGRYLMPIIPLIIIFGVQGLDQLLGNFITTFLTRSAVWVLLFGMVFFLWINGASDFSYRILLFNHVHMQAAQWINDHTPKDAVIATHDIGIIGYFTERPSIDLAGLITPEVVPLMKQPPKLSQCLKAHHVRYIIVYTGYYRELLNLLDANLIFSPYADELKKMGVEPFEIYEVP